MSQLTKPKIASRPIISNQPFNKASASRRSSHDNIAFARPSSSLSSLPTSSSTNIPSLQPIPALSESRDSFKPNCKGRSERKQRSLSHISQSQSFNENLPSPISISENAINTSSSILDPDNRETYQDDDTSKESFPAIPSIQPLKSTNNLDIVNSSLAPNLRASRTLGKIDFTAGNPFKRSQIHYSSDFEQQNQGQVFATPRRSQNTSIPSFSVSQFSKRLSLAQNKVSHLSLPLNDGSAGSPCFSSRAIKTRSLQSGSSTSLLLKDTKMILIKVKSNWGHPSTLLLSSISVLDEKKRSIPIQMISSIPNLPEVNLLERITDHNLVKKEDDIFTIPYSSTGQPFTLVLSLCDEDEPKYVRIWNPTIRSGELENAVTKDVVIIYENREAAKGHIPKNFGTDIEILPPDEENDQLKSQSSLLIDSLFPTVTNDKLTDCYGDYPLPKYTEVTIEVLQSYQKVTGMSKIGLNGIDFYDGVGNKLIASQFKIISVKNILKSTSFYSSPKYVIRENMFTNLAQYQFFAGCFYRNYSTYQQNDENNDGNNGEFDRNLNPVFVFKFNEQIAISKIAIWNFNAASEDLNDGIKNIIIRADNKIIFSGKVKIGKGYVVGLRKSTTMIWLTDSPNLRAQIKATESEEDHAAYIDNQ